MFKKIFFPVICAIFISISTSYAAPNNLVNLGTGNSNTKAFTASPALLFGAGSAALLGIALWQINNDNDGNGGGGGSASVTPTVTNVNPSSGPTSGGTPVTITGTNFVNGASLAVTFGGTAATSVTWVSSTQITCNTPAHAEGQVDVTVTNPGGQSGTKANGYTYADRIFLYGNSYEMYRVNQNAASGTNEEWTQIGKHPTTDFQIVITFSISPDGNTIFIVGVDASGNKQIYKIASNASSTTEWTKVGNAPTGVDEFRSFSVSSDGTTIFIAGGVDTTHFQMYKVATNASSATDWTQVGKFPAATSYIESFSLSSDGNTIFIASTLGTGLSGQMYKVAANAPDTTNWTQIGNIVAGQESIEYFALSSDENTIFIASKDEDANNSQMYKVAADAAPATAWTQVGNRPVATYQIKNFSLSPDGNTIFMNIYNTAATAYEIFKIASYAPNTTDWSQVGNAPAGINRISRTTLSSDGSTIFISGWSSATSLYQMYKIATLASPTTDWTQVGNRPAGLTTFTNFILSPDETTIFVNGSSGATNGQMYKMASNAPNTTDWTQVGNRPAGENRAFDFLLFPIGNGGKDL